MVIALWSNRDRCSRRPFRPHLMAAAGDVPMTSQWRVQYIMLPSPRELFQRHPVHRRKPANVQETLMKFNIEVDVTPEELRRFLGLPDVAPL